MFNQHHTDENVYKVTRVTKIIKLNEIITHVQLSQDIDTWKLSLADTQYLENYFQGISRNTGRSFADDEGRRVLLTVSRSGRLRRLITYTS